MIDTNRHLEAALRLHQALERHHWRDALGLSGPDPGIRFNYRIGRFVKSYLAKLPWRDRMVYTQGQAYWSLGNWQLFNITGDPRFRHIAERSCELLIDLQRDDGCWEYPNPEWKNRIATTEGNWASLAMLASFRQTGNDPFLAAARRWHTFLDTVTGYQKEQNSWAVNYFAHLQGARVPNNSVTTLRFLQDLAATAGDAAVAEPCPRLLTFLRNCQQPSGEFPYTVRGVARGDDRPHFQCFQYNAFACINLIECFRLTGDKTLLPMITNLADFLTSGQAEDGHVHYACHDRSRTVVYHAAAVAAALFGVAEILGGPYAAAAERSYDFILRTQRPDGGFPHSTREHWLLSDRRSYPRYQAMILLHLLYRGAAHDNRPSDPRVAHRTSEIVSR